jgi:hypothetical protein
LLKKQLKQKPEMNKTYSILSKKTEILRLRKFISYSFLIYPVIMAIGYYGFHFQKIFIVVGIVIAIHIIVYFAIYSLRRFKIVGVISFQDDNIIFNSNIVAIKNITYIKLLLCGYEGDFSGKYLIGYFPESKDGSRNYIEIRTNDDKIFQFEILLESKYSMQELVEIIEYYSSINIQNDVSAIEYS